VEPLMATITIKIKGQPVQVDERFDSLSPEDQQKTVNEIAAQMGIGPEAAPVAAAPAAAVPEQGSGVVENIAAAGNEAIIGTLAAPGTILYGAYNTLTQPPKEPASPEDKPRVVMPGIVQGALDIGGFLQSLGLPAAPTSEDVRKPFEDAFKMAGVKPPSEVKAVTPVEKGVRFFTEGALTTIAPELIVSKLARSGMIADDVGRFLQTIFGKGEVGKDIAKSAVVGGGATVGGGFAVEAAPEEWKPTVAMLASIAAGTATATAIAAPGAVVSTVKKTGEYLDPAVFGKSGIEREAGRQIIQSAQDVDNLVATLKRPTKTTASGVKPTLAEMTGDVGLAAAEKKAAQLLPEEYEARRMQVGTAREQALRSVQASGDASELVPAVGAYLGRVDALQDSIDAATLTRISALTDDLTRGAIDPETAGEGIRVSLEAGRKATRVAESALHEAVDPSGKLRTSIEGIKSTVTKLRDELKGLRRKPNKEERDLYQDITKAPEIAPYSEAINFQRRVSGMMRDELFRKGRTERWGRLSQLNKAAYAELENAVLVQIKREAPAIRSGRTAPEDSLRAKLSALTDELARQSAEAGSGAGARAAEAPGTPAAAVGGADAAMGGSERGLGGLAGGEGLPPASGRASGEAPREAVEPPVVRAVEPEPVYTPPPVDEGVSVEIIDDPEAMLRLRAAKDATIARVRTFDNLYLKPLLEKAVTGQEYKVAAEKVAGNIFNTQIDAAARIDALRAAVGVEKADDLLTGYALDRVVKEVVRDGATDAKKLESWRAKNADALKALPDLDAKLKDTASLIDAVSARAKARTKSLDAEKKRAVGPFLESSTGVLIGNDPKAVDAAVGSILTGQNAATKMKELRSAMRRSPDALEGLRKAVVDNVVSRFTKVTQGHAGEFVTLNAEPLLNFVRVNDEVLLAAGLTRGQINGMKAIATEAAQSSALLRAAVATRKPATLGNLTSKILSGQPQSILNRITLRQALTKGGMLGAMTMTGLGGVQLAADVALTVLRNKGLEQVDEIVARAMLDPDLARTLVQKVSLKNEKIVTRRLGEILARGTAVGTAVGLTEDAEEASP
jgi:predicted  nucleic acid-binding Zn-ribbon protein